MPLIERDYYTFTEAIENVQQALPKETPEENLLEVLRAGRLNAWIFDEETKKRISIPSGMWWNRWSDDFHCSLDGDLATLRVKGEGLGLDSVLGNHYGGEVQINKHQLDYLLDSATTAISSPPISTPPARSRPDDDLVFAVALATWRARRYLPVLKEVLQAAN